MNLLGPSILQGTKTIKNFKSCRAWKNNAMLNTCMFMQQCRNQPRLFFTRRPACQSVHVFFVHLRSGSRSSSSGLWEPPRLHRALFSYQGAMRPPHLLGATLASMAELSCWSLLQPANPHTISNTATHQARLQAHPQSTKRSGNLAPPQNCMQAGNTTCKPKTNLQGAQILTPTLLRSSLSTWCTCTPQPSAWSPGSTYWRCRYRASIRACARSLLSQRHTWMLW